MQFLKVIYADKKIIQLSYYVLDLNKLKYYKIKIKFKLNNKKKQIFCFYYVFSNFFWKDFIITLSSSRWGNL